MRRFDELYEKFAAVGVAVVALSKDSPQDAARHASEDGLSIELLCDPELDVIRGFGVEHHKAIEFSTGRFSLFGIPLALAPSIKAMAIPTSLLIDPSGVVRWIDQADDYRIRSDENRVLEAVEGAIAETAGSRAS